MTACYCKHEEEEAALRFRAKCLYWSASSRRVWLVAGTCVP